MPTPESSGDDEVEPSKSCLLTDSHELEPRKKRRKLVETPTSVSTTEATSSEIESSLKLDEWPDDIIIHFLQFLDLSTLENFQSTCKRIQFFIKINAKSLFEPFIASLPLTNDLQALEEARNHFHPSPPRHSFAYLKLLQSTYSKFETIADEVNPIKKCPREILYPDIENIFISPST